jgi:hypothetical protein
MEMGIGDSWDQPKSLSNYQALKEVVGICYNCEHLIYCKSQYGNVVAKCQVFELWLRGKDRIVDCNEHSERGSLNLRDMASMAVLIDPHKKEVKGFT